MEDQASTGSVGDSRHDYDNAPAETISGRYKNESIRLRKPESTADVDGNLKVDRNRQLKSGPPEQYWTGDYRGGLLIVSGFGSP